MKLVKEHINFERGLDPKKAMSTGVIYGIKGNPPDGSKCLRVRKVNRKEISIEEMREIFLNPKKYDGETTLEDFHGGSWTLEYILRTGRVFNNQFHEKYKYLALFDYVYYKGWYWPIDYYDDYLSESYKFKRGIDPKQAMDIGQRVLIDEWFETWAPNNTYTIDDNLNICVHSWLNLPEAKLTELPNHNLTIDGFLDLEQSHIIELPDNLTVKGWLDLRRTSITELPDNLSVEEWLDLRYTKITKLPDNLSVGGEIYKDF